MSTFKDRTGESWAEMLERHEKLLLGKISEDEFRAAERRAQEHIERNEAQRAASARQEPVRT